MPKIYTTKEDDIIREALKPGKTVKEISKLIKRTPRSVRTRIGELEQLNSIELAPQIIGSRPYTDADFELMHKIREENMTWKDIASRYFPGRYADSMRKMYKRHLRKKERG